MLLHAPKRPLNVLIVDDERFDRHRVARLCSTLEQPCEITNATTLAACEAALEAEKFDLIILDFQLPDGTGFDAMTHVRMSARNCTAGILMITGRGDADLAQRARADGCSDYLTKDGLNATAFQRSVKDVLEKAELAVRLENRSFAREEVETLLTHFAGQCARDLKPMLSRLMRQLRNQRRVSDAGLQGHSDLAEQNCMEIWQVLVDLERQDGKALLKTMAPKSDAALPRATRKPPSPFSRITH